MKISMLKKETERSVPRLPSFCYASCRYMSEREQQFDGAS